jgi:ribosome biogenesis GTPase
VTKRPVRRSSSAEGRPVERPGRVVLVEEGVATVVTRGRTLRASYGGALLGRIAQDVGATPRPGDRVRLCFWPDGPVTVERVVARPVPPAVPPAVP